MKESYLFLAPGFEEIEALATVDVMRRAGMKVNTVAVNNTNEVTGANGITAIADCNLNDVDCSENEWLICPGGMPGASNLAASAKLNELLTRQHKNGGKIAAICAAPAVVLAPLGILDGRDATCYPGFENECPNANIKQDTRVVALDTLITGNGPSSAIPFALAIVANSCGQETADTIASGMLVK